MKRTSILITMLLLSIIATTAASAAADLTATAITGNADQKETLTATTIIRNDGDNASLAITISDLTSGSDTISASSISISPATVANLETGQQQTITIKTDIDDNQALGTYTGTLTIAYETQSESGTIEADVTLEVQLGNHLIIDKVTVRVEGESDTVKDSEDVSDEANPGSTVEIEIRVKNDYDENIDIEDVEVTIEADNDLDWDDESDVSKIKDGDKETFTFTFEVPSADDVDEDTYDIDIEVFGTDEDGNDHGEKWTIGLEVDKKSYDLKFASLSVNYIDCGATSTKLRANIENAGAKDVSKGTLLIESSALTEDVVIRSIEIGEGDDDTIEATLPLQKNLQAGEYLIQVTLYSTSNEKDETDYDTVSLIVPSCGQTTTPPSEDNNDSEEETEIDIITPPTTTGNVVSTATGKPTKQFIGGSSNLYLGLLIVIVVLLVVLIALAASALGKRK